MFAETLKQVENSKLENNNATIYMAQLRQFNNYRSTSFWLALKKEERIVTAIKLPIKSILVKYAKNRREENKLSGSSSRLIIFLGLMLPFRTLVIIDDIKEGKRFSTLYNVLQCRARFFGFGDLLFTDAICFFVRIT